MVAFQSIPIVDIGPLVRSEDEVAQQQVGRNLHAACRDVGFFYVRNHGIDPQILRGVLQQARTWFSLPEEVKGQILLSAQSKFRGYQPLGANVTRYDGGFARDWHEGIDLYKEGQAGSREVTAVHGENQWPVQLPSFDCLLRQYIAACLRLGETIMRGIARGLGLPERCFEQPENGGTTAETSFWVTRVLHYPPLAQGDAHDPRLAQRAAQASTRMDKSTAPQDSIPARPTWVSLVQGGETERSVQLSCGEHTDYGLLTLVNQEAGITALQVKNQAGQWINAEPVEGALVCNLGDMLKVYTGGAYTSTTHRVINTDPTRSRVSIPFFYETAFDSVVKPIEQMAGANLRGADYKPVVYGQHLLRKVLSNFELDDDGRKQPVTV